MDKRILNKQKAKKILVNLGTVYRTDDLSDYKDPVKHTYFYEGYGLKIISRDLLRFESVSTEEKIKNIEIDFNESKVLDSGNDLYIPGIWEEILDELYDKIPTLLLMKQKEEKTKNHCDELFKNVLVPLFEMGITNEVENTVLNSYSDYDPIRDGEGIIAKVYKVSANGNEVFSATDRDWKGITYSTYIPGSWEINLKEYLYQLELEKEIKNQNQTQNNLEKLRKLR